MRRFLLFAAVLLLLSVPVLASDVLSREADILQTDTLYDGLDTDASGLIGDASPVQTDGFGARLISMLYDVLADAEPGIRAALQDGAGLLCIVLLCALASGIQTPFSDAAVRLAGALGITLACAGSLGSMVQLADQTLARIDSYMTLLLPVLSSVLTAAGGVTSGGALYVGSCLFFDVLVRAIRMLLMPLVYAYLAMAAAECAVGQERLLHIRELIGWVISAALKGIMYLFTAYLAITGLVSGSADAATLKAAKAAFSGAVPVVGGIISDASESVLAAAAILKNSAGVFGMLAVAAIALAPFVRIGTEYLAMKLAAAVSGAFGASAHTKLLGALSSAMGYLLAMTGSAALMALFSCTCFIRAVNG